LDTQRTRRGNDFLPPEDILSQIPPLYGTENTPPEDKTIFIHYFGPSSDHYIVELSQREEDGHRIAFGYAVLAAHPDGAEWGYTDLTELEAVLGRSPQGLPLLVERDCWWTPKPFRLVLKERS
jgi:hypothetical protein